LNVKEKLSLSGYFRHAQAFPRQEAFEIAQIRPAADEICRAHCRGHVFTDNAVSA